MAHLKWLTAIGIAQDAMMLAALIIFAITPKAGRKKFQLIGAVLAVGFFVDMMGFIGGGVFGFNMNLLNLCFTLFIVPAFFFFYRSKISSPKIITTFQVLMCLFFAFALVNAIFIQGITLISTYTMAFRGLVLMIYAITYHYVMTTELPRPVYVKLPIFWVNCALLTYYSVTFPIYLFTDYLYRDLKISIIPIWMVHNSVGVLYYTFLSIGLWRNRSLYTPQSSLKR